MRYLSNMLVDIREPGGDHSRIKYYENVPLVVIKKT